MTSRRKAVIRLDKQQIKDLALLALLIIALAAFYVGALMLSGAEVASGTGGPTPAVSAPAPCRTIKASKWNRLVRVERKLGGHRWHKLRKQPVCLADYKRVKAHVKRLRRDCLRKARSTEASVFWPGGDSGGMTSSCGYYLGNYRYGFAELGMGRYMGGIRCGTIVYVHRGGRTIAAPKLDIGYGSGSSGRGIDLWNQTGPALGISGVGQVTYSLKNCWARG